MTDIEQKALALLRECVGNARWKRPIETINRQSDLLHEALCRAIEQREAFRQEVSDAVEAVLDRYYVLNIEDMLSRFIIAKRLPDPLVEAIAEVDTGGGWDNQRDYANQIRAALEARGLEIREKNDDQ